MKLSDAEWTVMNAAWERPPVSARDVLDAVGSETDWAYTTVKTLLSRLVEKGALRERKRANTSLYEPLVTREQARRSALRSLVERAFDGTFGTLVQHMMKAERLSAAERKALAAMMKEAEADSDAPTVERKR